MLIIDVYQWSGLNYNLYIDRFDAFVRNFCNFHDENVSVYLW